MNKVELIHFNPKRRVFNGLLGKFISLRKPLNNFGDLLGPLVVEYLLNDSVNKKEAVKHTRLLTIGSIMHFAKSGDVIWGTGVNGKVDNKLHTFNRLDVRSVRGPLTRDFLLNKGIEAPEIYGDPGLLTPLLFPHLKVLAKNPKYEYSYIPNYNDINLLSNKTNFVDPRAGLMKCLEQIAQSRFVVGSSLHAIIVAESLGIPARLIKSKVENEFKYYDYYFGTERTNIQFANSLEEALNIGGEEKIGKDLTGNLVKSFPYDLWK